MHDDIMVTTEKLLFKTDGMGYVGRSISHEGVIDTIKSLIGTFATQLVSIKNVFSSNSDRLSEMPVDKKDLNIFARDLAKLRSKAQDIVQSYEYTDLMELNLPTIQKLDKTFPEVADELDKLYKTLNKRLEPCLNNLDTLISNIIGDVAFRTSSRPAKLDNDARQLSLELRDKLSKLLKNKNMNDVNKFKRLYPNVKSILDTYDKLVSMSSYHSINNLYRLKNYCKDIESKIDVMLIDIKDGVIEINKTLLVKLAEDLESNANIITLIVSYTEIYSQLVLCLETHIECIPKMVN